MIAYSTTRSYVTHELADLLPRDNLIIGSSSELGELINYSPMFELGSVACRVPIPIHQPAKNKVGVSSIDNWISDDRVVDEMTEKINAYLREVLAEDNDRKELRNIRLSRIG